ncbi:class I SAM-dependent methyltransferase [Pseudomonas sp. UW4]|uniref:class I SAM-dependent methyltransferase n=1 Tax=Pseudomonas sp. UW4 TaxID=1207075 RepID=UPI00029CF3CF|nr:class I SAM-dependent methyltransferase [Pseudomonas sp. UW4]AFY19324.1 hypothetical protein PputUW4_02122 [Pseudomonas sp. UW4]
MANFIDLVAKLGDPNEAPGGNIFLRRALSLLPYPNGALDILDIGSNTGSSTITIAEHFEASRITGIDIEEAMTKIAIKNIKRAKQNSRISFDTGDAQAMPYQNESFDLVVSSGSFAFIEKPEVAIEECYRVLKPDGFLIATEYFYKDTPPRALLNKITQHIDVDVSKFTFDYWVDAFINSGLGLEGIEQSPPPIFSPKIRLAQQESIKRKLGQANANKILEMDLDFIDNNKYLTIGTFLLRKPGVIETFGADRPTRN